MPSRIIDYDSVWPSDKLAACEEPMRVEYTWLYGLADANGSFEMNLRMIHGKVSPIRPRLSIGRLTKIFAEFERCGLLFTWVHNGKTYAHWVGSEKPGRLPPPSHRDRYGKRVPDVPKKELAAFQSRFDSRLIQTDSGLGLGIGVGLGVRDREGDGEAAKVQTPASASEFQFSGQHLKITNGQHRKLCEAFPDLDVASLYREQELWQDAHPSRRKGNGYAAMLNWLKIEREKLAQVAPHLRAGQGPQVNRNFTSEDLAAREIKLRQREEIRQEFEQKRAKGELEGVDLTTYRKQRMAEIA